MADDLIRKKFPDNYGRAWVELLESTLSEHARICYVAMTSFGNESRAGKASIARRMGVKSISTVKGAQDELIKAGWISRAQVGGGKTPTVWDVFSAPTGAQYALPRGVERPTPGRNTPPNQEGNHEHKRDKNAAAIPWLESYRQKWTAKTRRNDYARETGAVKAILELQAQGITLEQFNAKADAYLALEDDSFVAQSNWALLTLLRWRWNQLTGIPVQEGRRKPDVAI